MQRYQHAPQEQQGAGPEVELLLGIHQAAGLVLEDAALRTVLENVRLRVSDPQMRERRSRPGELRRPLSRGAKSRMKDILERAFANRIRVVPANATDELEPGMAALESTFSELSSSVAIQFQLVSLDDGSVLGTARAVAKGASFSFLARERSKARSSLEPAKNLASAGATPAFKSNLAAKPPMAETALTPPKTTPAKAPEKKPPLPKQTEPKPAASATKAPDWIHDILSHYPQRTGPDD